MDDDVRAFLERLPPEAGTLVCALQAVIRRTVPRAEESIVWGSLSYHRPDVGGRVKGAVCQIVVKGRQVRLDFIHGARLADPTGLLRGHQVSKRFVPIANRTDIDRPEVAALILQAASLDPAEWVEPAARSHRRGIRNSPRQPRG